MNESSEASIDDFYRQDKDTKTDSQTSQLGPDDSENLRDYEDVTYEEEEPCESEENIPLDDNVNASNDILSSSFADLDLIHSTLIHRYDLEVQKMHRLKTQSVFILTALGFIITIGVGIIGADWFSFTYFSNNSYLTFLAKLSLIVTLLCASYSSCYAIKSMISIDSDKKGLEYCWKYPNDEFLSKCAETKPEILFDKRVLCRTLAAIIIHNSENNQQTSNRLKNSFATFWVAFLFAIFTMILVVVICNSI